MNTMTEDEARQKWCPHAVASHTNPRTGFEPLTIQQPKLHYCIGSACMAWRWKTYSNQFSTDTPTKEWKGHCGLAGKP